MKRLEIKICGLYREEDIDYVNQYLPDYAGFVFYPKSHRNVSMECARHFRGKLDKGIRSVGVFVNERKEMIVDLAEDGIIDVIQLHGQEDEAYLEELRDRILGCEIWKAYKVQSMEDLRLAEKSSADRILLDNGYGTGACFDWELLTDLKRPFILAGGINAENVEEAVRRFGPQIIDVSSGVETDRKKDEEKIRTIIEKVRRM